MDEASRKTANSKKYIYTAFLIMTICLIYITIKYDKNEINYRVYKNLQISTMEAQLEAIGINVGLLEDEKKSSHEDVEKIDEEIKNYELEMEKVRNMISESKEMISSYENKAGKEFYELMDKQYEYIKSTGSTVGLSQIIDTDDLINKHISNFSNEVNDDFRNQLKKGNIKPMAMEYARRLTLYDKTFKKI